MLLCSYPGIGLAIANFLLEGSEKHNLVVLGRNQEALREFEARAPSRVKPLAGDFSNLSLGQAAVDLALSTFGRIDGLIINHGTLGEVNRIVDCDLVNFRKTFDINFISAVALVSCPQLQGILISQRIGQGSDSRAAEVERSYRAHVFRSGCECVFKLA